MSKAITLPFELVKESDEKKLPLHNLYHRRGILAAAQGVCWLVLAGRQLQAEKKKVGHGNWEQWVEGNCEYDIRTAQKYMGLADGVKGRALKTNANSFLKLLDKSPVDLKRSEQEELVSSVMSITDGETLQELYLGFGIVKKPSGASLRGSKRKHTPAGDVNDAAEEARDLWSPQIDFLESDGVERRSWIHLPADELKRLRSVLNDLNTLTKAKHK